MDLRTLDVRGVERALCCGGHAGAGVAGDHGAAGCAAGATGARDRARRACRTRDGYGRRERGRGVKRVVSSNLMSAGHEDDCERTTVLEWRVVAAIDLPSTSVEKNGSTVVAVTVPE